MGHARGQGAIHRRNRSQPQARVALPASGASVARSPRFAAACHGVPLCPRSFDEFIQNKMQDVVDEQLPIEILPEPQVPEDHPDYIRKKFRFKFGQIYLSTPQLTEKDGTTDTMRPMVARIRNLTYCAPLFVDISKTVTEVDENGADIRLLEKEDERMFIGKIPIMLQSTYCVLKGQANKGLTDMGEVRTTNSLPALHPRAPCSLCCCSASRA